MSYAFYAGKMRDRITIRRRVEAKNPTTGGLELSWTSLAADLSAEVLSLNGREALLGHVLQGISTFQVTIRYRTDIKASDQVLWNGRELNVVSAPEDQLGTRQWVVMQASTQAPQGA